jgi:hypothetical protein
LLRANVALKHTHLGLELGEELAYENVRVLVERAEAIGSFIRIDMEQSAFVDATLGIHRRLREAGLASVGCVLQSYLYRSERDLDTLLPTAPNLRLVKGAYLEPPDVAYPRKADVDAAYVRLLEASLAGHGYTAVATHDARLIEHAVRGPTETAAIIPIEKAAARVAGRVFISLPRTSSDGLVDSYLSADRCQFWQSSKRQKSGRLTGSERKQEIEHCRIVPVGQRDAHRDQPLGSASPFRHKATATKARPTTASSIDDPLFLPFVRGGLLPRRR